MNSTAVAVALVLLVAALASPAPSVAETPQTIDAEMARSLVDEVIPEVEKVRGLTFKKPVEVLVTDDDGAREHMLARLDAFDVRDQLVPQGRALELLGMLPPGTDLLGDFLEALREQAGGFYDPASGTFYLLDDMPVALASSIIAHELTHALEDQYYALDDRLRKALDDDDLMFAQSAVHEGSAMLVMTGFMTRQAMAGKLDMETVQAIGESQADQNKVLMSLPPILQRQMIGPYVLGASFLLRGNMLRMAGAFPEEDVNRAFDSGPLSSEQILHPEKYWEPEQRDDPQPVRIDRAGSILGGRWKLRGSGVLGEINIALMTGSDSPIDLNDPMAILGSWTNEAAHGWDGDRWELWSRGGADLVLLGTVWDSDEDAQEFAAILQDRDEFRVRRASDRVAVIVGAVPKSKKLERLWSAILDDVAE